MYLEDNIYLGNVTVTEGSGSNDVIDVGTISPNLQLGTVYLTQGSGSSDSITVANDEVASLLDITQGGGAFDTVSVNDITGVTSTTLPQYAKVVITQGDGAADYVYVGNERGHRAALSRSRRASGSSTRLMSAAWLA